MKCEVFFTLYASTVVVFQTMMMFSDYKENTESEIQSIDFSEATKD